MQKANKVHSANYTSMIFSNATCWRIKFPKIHKGMIEINGLPNFSFVYIHIGNTYRQTAGCPLCGFGFDVADGDYQIVHSKEAYEMIYPKLLAIAESNDKSISIENNFQF